MRKTAYRAAVSAAVIAGLAVPFTAGAQNSSDAVEQSIPPPVPQKPAAPPLHLSDAQRAKIRDAVSLKNTEITFALKTTKPAKNFQPAVGAPIPKSLKPLALPAPLIYQMPQLKNYGYLKLKHQVLIVNPMTRKIVDMFPEDAS